MLFNWGQTPISQKYEEMEIRVCPQFQRIFLTVLLLMASTAAYAELSITNKWRIDQAVNGCKESKNTLQYPEYWQDGVTEENKETLCMAEQFAALVVMDGDEWLEEQSGPLIRQCKEQSKKNEKAYFSCLQKDLEQTTRILSSSCRELGAAGLWDEQMCRRLISYIFIKKFETVLEAKKPLKDRIIRQIDQFGDTPVLHMLFNPVLAVIFLTFYVLDMALFIDPGNWMGVSKIGFLTGLAILGSCFTKGGLSPIISGGIMAILLIKLIWNHLNLDTIPIQKRKKSSKKRR